MDGFEKLDHALRLANRITICNRILRDALRYRNRELFGMGYDTARHIYRERIYRSIDKLRVLHRDMRGLLS